MTYEIHITDYIAKEDYDDYPVPIVTDAIKRITRIIISCSTHKTAI